MRIRKYNDEDFDCVTLLFFDTVHTVNAKDYTSVQLTAWVNSSDCLKSRRNDLLNLRTLVAEIDGAIVGFGSIDKTGYLDLLFVHKDFQKHGIATNLCNELEKDFSLIKTFASVTAKSFFEDRGYTVISVRVTERLGVALESYEMEKRNTV